MRNRILFCLALLLTLQACNVSSFKSNDLIVDELDGNYTLNALYEDEYGNKGIIAYISDENDWLDRVIAISLDESYESWGPMGEAVYKSEGINFDTITNYYILYYPAFGLAMLQSMKSTGIERFPAQQWCDKKNIGDPYSNVSSWRLPSLSEWLLISGNAELNHALQMAGGTPLQKNQYYWTCTEDFEGFITLGDSSATFDRENRAIPSTTDALTLHDKDNWIKKNKYHVRAIKYVYYAD